MDHSWIPLPPRPTPSMAAQVTAEESNVATRILAVLGAVVFIAGVVFFLKLAFDRGWIAPAARLALGVVGGLALWGLGATLDQVRRMPAYGQTLVALGAIMVYVTTWLAYQLPSFRDLTGLSVEGDALLLGVVALALVAHAVLRRAQWLAFLAFGLVVTTVFVATSWTAFSIGYLVLMTALLVAAAGLRRWTALLAAAGPVAFAILGIHLLLGTAAPALLAGVAALMLAFTVAGLFRAGGTRQVELQASAQVVAWLGGGALAWAAAGSWDLADAWLGAAAGLGALVAFALAALRALPTGSRVGWGCSGVAYALVWPALQFDGPATAMGWAGMALAVALTALVLRSRTLGAAAAAMAAWTFGRLVLIDAPGLAAGELGWAGGLLLFATATTAALVGWLAAAFARRTDAPSWMLLAVACLTPMLYAASALAGPVVTLVWAGVFLLALAAGILASRADLRVAGLAALGPVLVRLVFFDLSGVDVVLRVLAYTGVGAALLVGAYVYARAATARRSPRGPPPSPALPTPRAPPPRVTRPQAKRL